MNTINSSERRNHSERYHEAPVPIKEVVDDVMNDLFDTLVLNTKNVADTLIKLVEQLDQKKEYTDLFMTELLGIRTLLEEINASKKDLISNEADLMYIVEGLYQAQDTLTEVRRSNGSIENMYGWLIDDLQGGITSLLHGLPVGQAVSHMEQEGKIFH